MILALTHRPGLIEFSDVGFFFPPSRTAKWQIHLIYGRLSPEVYAESDGGV